MIEVIVPPVGVTELRLEHLADLLLAHVGTSMGAGILIEGVEAVGNVFVEIEADALDAGRIELLEEIGRLLEDRRDFLRRIELGKVLQLRPETLGILLKQGVVDAEFLHGRQGRIDEVAE